MVGGDIIIVFVVSCDDRGEGKFLAIVLVGSMGCEAWVGIVMGRVLENIE